MKIKVSELEGAKLDYWVGVSHGLMVEIKNGVCFRETSFGKHEYNPSSNWSQGGPIIEREKMGPVYDERDRRWFCMYDVDTKRKEFREMVGTTPLIAAMRAYVASKFGEEVEE